MHVYSEIIQARDYIREQTNLIPTFCVIIDSELDDVLTFLNNTVRIPASDIPFFPSYFLEHQNLRDLIIGQYNGNTIVVLKGRYKYYEGFSLDHITFPIRVMRALGVHTIVLSRVAGAINSTFNPGDLMLVTDHINLTGMNPLIGPYEPKLGPRFIDVTNLYNTKLRKLTKEVALKNGIHIRDGVVAWFTGPSFETPAEIRMLKQLDIDAVASAIVPEALVAHHSGMNVLGILLLTNMAAGLTKQPIKKQTIVNAAKQQQADFNRILKDFIKTL